MHCKKQQHIFQFKGRYESQILRNVKNDIKLMLDQVEHHAEM